MSRPALEVADILRDHGAAWRSANAGHLSLDQLKVMSAIERCRTAALGGHVARCEDCTYTLITYNSCRNRHCPKCQGAAAKQWLAEREAELLPVPYFHLVFTLPGPIADIAYQNKAAIYDLLFKAAAEATLTIAADPKHLGASIGITAVLHTWGSALTHHPHLHMIVPGGGISLEGQRWIACRPTFFLPVRVLSRLFRRLLLKMLSTAHNAGRLAFFGNHAALAAKPAFATSPQGRVGRLCQQAVCRAAGRARLPVALHTPRRHLQSPADLSRRCRRHVQVQGLQDRRARPVQDHDAAHPRVHPALSDARAAQGRAPHPSLWVVRQQQPCRQHRAGAPATRRTSSLATARDVPSRTPRRAARAAASMSMLRWPHDHHRDLRARLSAKAPPHARSDSDQDRHLMILSPPILNRRSARYSCWLSASSADARGGPLDWPTLAPSILSRYVHSARSPLNPHPCFEPKKSAPPLRSNFHKPYAAAESP